MTEYRTTRAFAGLMALVAATVLSASGASATEGYFALGNDAVQRAQGGAGVAHSVNAMSATVNPAGIVDVGRELQLGLELFSPNRGFEATGTGFVPATSLRSDKPLFPIPNFSYNMPLANGDVFNISAYGNGGMNTTYPVVSAGCGSVYCGGPAGVDLSQLFVSATYARKVGNLSFGISPTLAVQAFSAEGLAAFSGVSSDAAKLTDNGRDWSHGFGLKAGMQVDLSDTLHFGLAAQTKMKMSKFKKYAGLFEDGGSFDIPASFTVGVAWDARPDLTLMADYQRIFYSGVGAIGNAGNAGPLGAKGGAGFGWDDIGIIKLGAEWRKSDRMTWRAGYAYSENPIGPEDVTLNIIAPGVVQHHLTVGGSYSQNQRDSFDFAVTYAVPNSVSGPEVTPAGTTPGSSIKIDMHQVSATLGWSRKF
ncbi:OmpP1/FadL family transporter [Pseudogemmobacter sp. W21_MBD1_M6]|uniref:OmpP1/FadL family transporter n=1 Tax=Pseudogemmobacter sp. W21_MBD1_M6 TaxID=3240271 RepID=UPI003F99A969